MAIKRYIANADTTITNAYQSNLKTRGTGSNMGRADTLEIFSIYGQESSGSSELSRVLLNFPISTITTDRAAGTIPDSGSVSFYLRMFNAVTPYTVPRNFTLVAAAVSGAKQPNTPESYDFSWQEGNGVDMEGYTDVTRDGDGANWFNMGSSSVHDLVIKWGSQASISAGGAYFTDASSSFTQTFDDGTEDLEMDITTLVEQWLNSTGNVLGSKTNYGIGVHLTASQEALVLASAATTASPANTQGAKRSYYTKKFFARSSEFFFKRPMIEARWDSARKDDRGNTFYSSSLVPSYDNLNTIYLYNFVRGQLRDIPDIGASDYPNNIYCKFYSGSADNTGPSDQKLQLVADGTHVVSAEPTVVTGGYVSTGIYSASFAITASTTPLEYIFDVWFSGSDTAANRTQYHTGTIEPKTLTLGADNPTPRYVSKITNLRPVYSTDETARFRVFTRQKDWNPSIYTRAVSSVPPLNIDSGSFAVIRIVDGVRAIEFGTGSDLHTQISFDVSGNYFDLDMGTLEPGYAYKIKFAYYNGSIGDWQEQPEEFKFRVE